MAERLQNGRQRLEDFEQGRKEEVVDNMEKLNGGVQKALPRASREEEVFSGLMYCSASLMMILLNKAVLSSFDFHAPNALLLLQCMMAVLLISILRSLGWVPMDKLNMEVVKLWWPVNMLFVGMVWTSFYSLKNLSVPMVTILKNSTNFLVIFSDWVVFSKSYGLRVWGAASLILLASVVGGITDLSFSWAGYSWQALNCLTTAGYSVYLKLVMAKVAATTGKANGLEQSTMVLYNNLLALPWVLLLMYLFGEMETVWEQPALADPKFIAVALASGLIGFLISFASLYFLSNTTPAIYSLTGSLNKVPTAIFGIVVFKTPLSLPGVFSLLFGLGAGILFVFVKTPKK